MLCYRKIEILVSEIKLTITGHEELEKFVRKFITLWESGSNARLHVETEEGNAFVIHRGLGQAQPLLGSGQHGGGGCRGGSPAKQFQRV